MSHGYVSFGRGGPRVGAVIGFRGFAVLRTYAPSLLTFTAIEWLGSASTIPAVSSLLACAGFAVLIFMLVRQYRINYPKQKINDAKARYLSGQNRFIMILFGLIMLIGFIGTHLGN